MIETRRGRMRQKAVPTRGIDPRVAGAQHGWWFPDEPGPEYGVWRSNVTLLTDNEPPCDPAMAPVSGARCRAGSCPRPRG